MTRNVLQPNTSIEIGLRHSRCFTALEFQLTRTPLCRLGRMMRRRVGCKNDSAPPAHAKEIRCDLRNWTSHFRLCVQDIFLSSRFRRVPSVRTFYSSTCACRQDAYATRAQKRQVLDGEKNYGRRVISINQLENIEMRLDPRR